ncbi:MULTISPECIES: DUF937 domain-containing protein [Stenotrophomonas]|jgi:hypothetical protein|uniref:DUF937 domain-containing protein n=1 Tax=Stenotrophomonas aracearum TaxID=3003272 RepID=A0ABY9YHC5_9GAMM|nr:MULTISPECIES: DUF937 domain-containing protein [unclassified Stenotrophomonas]WNH49865.1 DUF937 domain-containing protein [Stenotrophomonas sp. A5588]
MLRPSHPGAKESVVNANSLTQALFSQLQQGQGLQQVSQQLGLEPQQASSAISAAVPLLLGALGTNASQPQGAQSLLNALQKDHLGGGGGAGGLDIGGILGAVLGGGGSGATNGAGILGHMFGGQTSQAAQLLGQKTGLDSGRSTQLLAVLAPIVMSFLAQRFAQQGNAGELSQALGAETPASASGGIGGLLNAFDQDGDGKFGASDVVGMLFKR